MNSTKKRPLAVVAVGGNALIKDDDHVGINDQYEAVIETAAHIVDMIEAGWRVVVTHGNGPQVGFIMRRSELAIQEVLPVPLDYAVADTQGAIGYMFQKALSNELKKRGIDKPVVSLVTQTLVSLDDPAFSNPTKPIGAFMDEKTAQKMQKELGWSIMEDAGRGWRRTVASPQPCAIQEIAIIATLMDQDALVIAAGGGGIPVSMDQKKQLSGVEAVIDKDLASALLAKELKADLFLIPTGVEKVAVNFGKPDQLWLDSLSVDEAKRLCKEGQFGKGSMQPKIEAILSFLEATPHAQGLITTPDAIKRALIKETGTWISK